jgi:tetratricopeptide (TPR) repeat protein
LCVPSVDAETDSGDVTFDKQDRNHMANNKTSGRSETDRTMTKVQMCALAAMAVLLIFQVAISVRVFVADKHVRRGDIYREMDRADDACTEYARAVEVHRKSYTALHLYGSSLLSLDKTEEAIKILDRCLDLAPYHPLALDLMATALMKQKSFERALEFVDRANEVVNDWPRMLRTRGRILLEQGLHTEARSAFEKALDAGYDPIDEMYRGVALTYINEGRRDLALQVIDKALDNNPEEALNHLIRGQLLVQTGDWNNAGEALQRAVNLFIAGSTSVSSQQVSHNKEQAHLGLVVVYLRQDRLARAANEIFLAISSTGGINQRSSTLIEEIIHRVDNDNHDMSELDVARTRFLIARTLFAAGDQERRQRGIIELRRVTEMTGVEARIRAAAHAELARILTFESMYTRALAELEKAKQLSPSLPDIDAMRENIINMRKAAEAQAAAKS